jgi:Arc/MetJ family transcription regulator
MAKSSGMKGQYSALIQQKVAGGLVITPTSARWPNGGVRLSATGRPLAGMRRFGLPWPCIFASYGILYTRTAVFMCIVGGATMRTNVVIDDELLAEAMRCTGLTTKKAVIDEALNTLVRLRHQSQVRQLRGQLKWEGDLAALREGRFAVAEPAAEAESGLAGANDVDR